MGTNAAPPTSDFSLPYQWHARPYQVKLWDYLRRGGKRAVAVWHRRAGKDELCLHHTACAAFERVGNYGHMLPKYSQARKAIWNAVNAHTGKRRIDEAFPMAIRAEQGGTNDQEMMIKFTNGSTWQVLGSDEYNSLMGTAYAGLVFSEQAQANPAAWGYFAPILLENNGWALFISTPRGKNHFHDLLKTAQEEKDWFAEVLSNDETHVFTPEQLDAELRRLQRLHGDEYGKALHAQEYLCSFEAQIIGSIWGDCVARAEREGRITDFTVDKTRPVYTAWDLGRSDDTAIWFYQFNGRGIDIFDYFASPGMDISNEEEPEKGLVQLLLRKADHYGITYERHWLPHDARPRTQAAGGKSILQQFMDAKAKYPRLGSFAIVKRLDKQEGIQAGRATFPHVRLHATHCFDGIEALRYYHREWDEEMKKFVDAPAHDWSSHGADAFRYLSLSWKYPKEAEGPEAPLADRLMAGNPVTQTFGKIKDQLFKRKARLREESLA